MKTILFIAYHFPPVKVSSAVQRTLKFTKYLGDHDWQSIVLTISPKAAVAISEEQMSEIPDNVIVKRSFALDTAKHLAIKGRYLSWMALPDQWISWTPFAVRDGLKLIKRYKPDVILSTYPIASAHIVGYFLHKLTNIPWVADFRDSMTDEVYPSEATKKKFYQWLENKFINYCTKAVFTTEGTVKMYADRYPDFAASHWQLIANGYDEENFIQAQAARHKPISSHGGPLTLLHSGVIYPEERDPRAFLSAIAQLKFQQQISGQTLNIILRATGHDDFIQSIINDRDIGDIVSVAPSLPYTDALTEMLSCDGLILMQASNCNHQIPAKAYEYLRSQRPILALTDEHSDTARLLLNEGIKSIIPLDKQDKICQGLLAFIAQIKNGNITIPNVDSIKKYSRQAHTDKLAQLLNEIISSS